MLESFGNFWDEPGDAHVITTNGTVKANGRCVMGRGIAKQAKSRFPGLDKELGKLLMQRGNCVHPLGLWSLADGRIYNIYSFPVKANWWEKANLVLIERSCAQLTSCLPPEHDRIVMVRPGCGNGQLSWDVVRPLCEQYLNNRFLIVERRKNE